MINIVSMCHSILQQHPLSCLPQLLSLFFQVDIFRGFTLPEGPMFRQVFGGQLIGQALFLPPSLPDIPFCLISLVLFFFLKHAGELRIIVLIGIKFLDTRRIHGLDQYFYTCVPETKEDYHTRPTQMQQGTQPPCSCHGPKAQLLSDFLQHHLSPWLGVVKHADVPGLPNGSLVFII